MAYEIRAMSFGEILDTGFRLVRDHFGLLVGLSALVNVPVALVTGKGLGMGTPGHVLTLVGVGLYLLVAGPIVGTAVTFAVGELFVGRAATAGQAIRHVLGLFGALAATATLSGLAVLAGFVLLIVPGVYLMLAFMLVWQVVVLEGISGTAALRRSRVLMRGNMLRGFGVLLLGMLVSSLVAGVLGAAFGVLGSATVAALGRGLAQAIGNAFTSAVAVVLYFDIRCRHEAFDLEHLAQLVAAGSGEPQPV